MSMRKSREEMRAEHRADLEIDRRVFEDLGREIQSLRSKLNAAVNVLTAIDNYVYNHKQEGTWNLEEVQAMARKTLQEIEEEGG